MIQAAVFCKYGLKYASNNPAFPLQASCPGNNLINCNASQLIVVSILHKSIFHVL